MVYSYIYAMEYYLAIEWNEWVNGATTWMNESRLTQKCSAVWISQIPCWAKEARQKRDTNGSIHIGKVTLFLKIKK